MKNTHRYEQGCTMSSRRSGQLQCVSCVRAAETCKFPNAMEDLRFARGVQVVVSSSLPAQSRLRHPRSTGTLLA